jgi:DNA-binding NarL/FixJ family response regulator
LTSRQLEILILYSRGLRGPEVASLLHLQPITVESHLENIRERLGTKSVAHSIVVSIARGMLVVDVGAETATLTDQDLVAA